MSAPLHAGPGNSLDRRTGGPAIVPFNLVDEAVQLLDDGATPSSIQLEARVARRSGH